MIEIKSGTTDRLLSALNLLRPDIITSGDKHIITYKGSKYSIPLSITSSNRKGNTR